MSCWGLPLSGQNRIPCMSATSAPTTLPANRTALTTSTWWAGVSEPHPKPASTITYAETVCLALRLPAPADLWHDPTEPHKSREKIKDNKIRKVARQVVDSAYVSRCCHNTCLNDKCETYCTSGNRNIVSNSFRLAQPETKKTCEPGIHGVASDSSRAREVMTICLVCRSRNTAVTACPGRLHLEILLAKTHDAIAMAAPSGSPGIAVVYFQGPHTCFTVQDSSKRIGKNKLAEHAASSTHSTPSKVVHDVITEFLTQVRLSLLVMQMIFERFIGCDHGHICHRSLLSNQSVKDGLGVVLLTVVHCCCSPINL